MITVDEIEAAVDGGADSPALEVIIRKLEAVKRPPKRMEDPRVRELMVRGFAQFLRDPIAAFARAAGVSVEAAQIARTVRAAEREHREGASHG
jgi:hypothetical protein